ncbi:hypothetical protein ACFFRR_001866 [Megaselia abdita]
MRSLSLILLLIAVFAVSVRGGCDEKPVDALKDGVLKATGQQDPDESEIKNWFKDVGCSIQKGASKIQDGAKKLGGDIADGAKKFGQDVKSKFGEWKDKITGDDVTTEKAFLANVDAKVQQAASVIEVVNPDNNIKKCSNGYILDSLGGCKQI